MAGRSAAGSVCSSLTGVILNDDHESATGVPSASGKEGESEIAGSAPPTLSKETVDPLTTGQNGQFSWGIQWSLNNSDDSTNGWIIQHVEINQEVTAWSAPLSVGTTMPIEPGRDSYGGLSPSWSPMWEAWEVEDGVIFAGDYVTPYSKDTYKQPMIGENTMGKTEVRGRAAFYPDVYLPMHFEIRNAPPAWVLPVTNTDPGMGDGTGIISHDITATWDGVNGDGTTTAVTV
jgi:hypothetical protein